MKTLQVLAPGRFEVREEPTPTPGPGELLMEVRAVTTCPQWDLHLWRNEPMFPGRPFTYPYPPGQPGHEATGVVAALGPGVEGLRLGDRISAWKDPGHAVPGCYAQYALRRVEHVIRVPESLPPEATAPVELAMCVGAVFLLLREMDAVAGRRFGITGLGPAGLIALQMARAEGAAEIVGFDLSEQRREAARALGADDALDPREDSSGQFPARPAAAALDTGVDCVGAPESVEFLMDRVRDVVALFGVQRDDYRFAPRHYLGLRLCGYRGHSREAAEYAVGLMSAGKLDLAPLATHRLPLERYDEGVALLQRQEAIKICFLPWA